MFTWRFLVVSVSDRAAAPFCGFICYRFCPDTAGVLRSVWDTFQFFDRCDHFSRFMTWLPGVPVVSRRPWWKWFPTLDSFQFPCIVLGVPFEWLANLA
jgi:hypothetical protein